jgi:predicted small integral membrane protein
MLLRWWAGVRLLKSYRADGAQFAAALNVAMVALTTSLLMWLVAFLAVGGEWFLMWQSKMEWSGRGIPNVHRCRCGALDCGTTGASSRLVPR